MKEEKSSTNVKNERRRSGMTGAFYVEQARDYNSFVIPTLVPSLPCP